MRGLLAVVLLLLAGPGASPATAGFIETPECRRDMATADQLIRAARRRESTIKPGDPAALCRVLRQNLQAMTEARAPMARCTTGRDLGENVGRMDASIGGIRDVLAKHCGGR
jgi:hypothetical protein